MSRLSGVDPFLFHVPDAPRSKPPTTTRRGAFESNSFTKVASEAPPADWLPVLVHLPNANAPFNPPAEFRVASRLGNVLSGRGSKVALVEIGKREGVSVEVSRDGGDWELDKSVSTVNGHPVAAPEGAAVENQCIVGIIDAGLDPLHDAFLGADGRTRIRYIWDQTATGGRKPSALKPFVHEYGAVYTAEDIDRALTGGPPLPTLGVLEDHRIHGTHVASIAAGRRAERTEGETSFAGGMAPDAPIVFVIPVLKSSPEQAPSEGFAKSHFDALKFIEAVAERLALPVVVNLSAGIAAGAHDGSSALEAGFDAFTQGGRAPGRAIVKSAGNARGVGHYRRFSLATGALVTVKLNASVEQDAATVEVWFSSAHELAVKLSEAQRKDSFTLSLRQHEGKLATAGGTASLTYLRYHFDNGDSQLLIKLPPTYGGFSLEFSGIAMRGRGEIDLWVEGPLVVDRATEERTLTAPGTARSAITVASSDRAGQAISETSSYGPTRDERNKPELFAPGIDIRAAKAGTRSDTVAKKGTSMAAPHVTGAIALLFSKQKRLKRDVPNALQTRKALIATAAQMNGNWQTDRGFGLLDAQALLAAFDPPTPAPDAEPAPAPAAPDSPPAAVPPAPASALGDVVPQEK